MVLLRCSTKTALLLGIVSASLPINAAQSFFQDLYVVEYPEYRYTAWSDLDPATEIHAYVLGYSAVGPYWNTFMDNPIESLDFGSLTFEQQTTAVAIGFPLYPGYTDYSEEWDCYVNHVENYDWQVSALLFLIFRKFNDVCTCV